MAGPLCAPYAAGRAAVCLLHRVRSSRQIERRCHEDIAFRVRHEQALAGLLIQSLKLCAAAGLVRLGLVALDGTKIEANAAAAANRTHAHLEQQVAELAAAARARGQRPRTHIRPRRRDEAPNPKATINTTDPDRRFVHGNGRTLQGYNAQAAATCEQVVVAAELTQQANDLQQLAPMLAAIRTTLAAAGIDAGPQRLAPTPATGLSPTCRPSRIRPSC